MEPLFVFIAKVRAWHVLAVVAFALIFSVAGYLTENEATSRAESLELSIFSIVAIPIMLFALAFLAYAYFTKDFRAAALFPSIFVVIASFVAVGIIEAGINDSELSYPIVGAMGLVMSLLMSGLICGMIAIRRRRLE